MFQQTPWGVMMTSSSKPGKAIARDHSRGLSLAVRHAGTNLQQAVQAGDGRQELFQQKYDVTEEVGAEEDNLFQPVDDSVLELSTLPWGTRGSSWSPMQRSKWEMPDVIQKLGEYSTGPYQWKEDCEIQVDGWVVDKTNASGSRYEHHIKSKVMMITLRWILRD